MSFKTDSDSQRFSFNNSDLYNDSQFFSLNLNERLSMSENSYRSTKKTNTVFDHNSKFQNNK